MEIDWEKAMKKFRLMILTGILACGMCVPGAMTSLADTKKNTTEKIDALVISTTEEQPEFDEPEIEEAIDAAQVHGSPLDTEKKDSAASALLADPGAATNEKADTANTASSFAGPTTAVATGILYGPGMQAKSSARDTVLTELTSASADRQKLVEYALSFLGGKYQYGGNTPAGFDCSGFTQYVFKNAASKSLLRNSASQSTQGREVSAENMQIGDLLFYSSGSRINHVAIYIGDGKVVHASNESSGVKLSPWDYRNPVAIRNVLD